MCFVRKIYEKNFSKVKIYDRMLWKTYASVVAFLSSLVTLISFFCTAKESRIGVSGWIIVYILLLIVSFTYCWWDANRLKTACLWINNTRVEVIVGDIFDQFSNPDKHEGEISVIAVNDFYDVIVDDRIVANKSLHGQYIKKIISAGKLEALNMQIENNPILNKMGNPKEEPARKEGRKVRYDIGSLVEFENYILTAFTNFDADNKAFLSADEYMHFWMKFWENIDDVYAGRTINIPLMGAGITRFRNGKPTKQQLLESMLWSLKISGFHNTYGDKKIRFIIYEPDADEINFYSIQHNMK